MNSVPSIGNNEIQYRNNFQSQSNSFPNAISNVGGIFPAIENAFNETKFDISELNVIHLNNEHNDEPLNCSEEMKKINELRKERDELTETLNSITDLYEELLKTNKQNFDQNENLNSTNEDLKNKLAFQKKINDSQKNEFSETLKIQSENIRAQIEKIIQLEEVKQILENKNAEVNTKCAILSDKCEKQDAELFDLNKKVNEINLKYENREKVNVNKIQLIQIENDDCRKKIDNIQKTINDQSNVFQSDNNNLKNIINEKEEMIRLQRNETGRLKSEKLKLEENIITLNNNIEKISIEMDQLKIDYNTMNENLVALQKEFKNKTEKLNDVETSLENNKKYIGDLESQNAVKDKIIQEKIKAFLDKENSLEILSKNYQKECEQKKILQSEKESIKVNYENLKVVKDSLVESVTNLKKELEMNAISKASLEKLKEELELKANLEQQAQAKTVKTHFCNIF
ncbi:MAG: hypothetical protein H0V82_07900 [Candidatus Protochlamydia sp.]|nr:hypothetical protein [Candidatus Protochlamydia sp.]